MIKQQQNCLRYVYMICVCDLLLSKQMIYARPCARLKKKKDHRTTTTKC